MHIIEQIIKAYYFHIKTYYISTLKKASYVNRTACAFQAQTYFCFKHMKEILFFFLWGHSQTLKITHFSAGYPSHTYLLRTGPRGMRGQRCARGPQEGGRSLFLRPANIEAELQPLCREQAAGHRLAGEDSKLSLRFLNLLVVPPGSLYDAKIMISLFRQIQAAYF